MVGSRTRDILATSCLLALFAACGKPEAGPPAAVQHKRPEGRFHLGDHAFKVTTASAEAQRAFDRGLTYTYAFAHEAAEEEYRKAAAADPKLAMAWWGVALVNGPHINFPLVPPDKAKVAWEALTKAKELAPGAGDLEKSLIEALGTRYADPQPENRGPLDVAYAEAMKKVWQANPQNGDVATLTAEALMDLHPWDLWKHDGTAQPWTGEILTTLETAMKLAPKHPGANHLYIHTVEASPDAAKGIASADLLRDLVPGASHLVHMPAHIYARVGRWEDSAQANVVAMAADENYRAEKHKPGLYAMYMAHNDHFYAYAAMTQGKSAEAIKAARKMIAAVPPEFLRDYAAIADGYMIFVSEALMRFGKWDDILKEPEPAEGLPLSRALWRFTRAVSLNALGRFDEAEKERTLYREAVKKVPKDWFFGNNSAADILSIATLMLDGEMAASRDRFDESVKALEQAVKIEDGLKYNEPPDWIQPVRHTLGAVLMRAGRYADAEAVYREDLRLYPENGWSLFGLRRALQMQKKDADAATVDARFMKEWSKADVTLGSTCYCQPGV